jgi:hypothetical protein
LHPGDGTARANSLEISTSGFAAVIHGLWRSLTRLDVAEVSDAPLFRRLAKTMAGMLITTSLGWPQSATAATT